MPFSLGLALYELLIRQRSVTVFKDQKSQRTETATETIYLGYVYG